MKTGIHALDLILPYVRRHIAWLVGIFTLFTYTTAFPPYDNSQLAFICFIPLILWAATKPKLKVYLITNFLIGLVSWSFLLSWLRHIGSFMEGWAISGYIAIFLISTIFACFHLLWAHFLRAVMISVKTRNTFVRFSGIFGIAGLWVVLEFSKTFFIFGFPWLPLAASQWKNPLMLQSASILGFYGVSFLIILINLGIAFYLRHIFGRKKPGKISFLKKLCPEFYMALGCVACNFYLFTKDWPASQPQDLLFHATIIQPDIPQSVKWDPNQALANWFKLENLTKLAVEKEPKTDLIFWPESATPTPILGDDSLKVAVESLVNILNKPLITGNMGIEGNPERIYNGVFVLDPENGLLSPFYKKRKLVPFGEYIPMQWFPFITDIFWTGWDFSAGNEAITLPVRFASHTAGDFISPEFTVTVGPLVCYEDIFPSLSRSLTKNGADFLFVTTNNAWFGREGAAYQHAAHSVLRAVENRRPVIRCGNAGWSGWIDEYGFIRDFFQNDGTIYTEGYQLFPVTRYLRFVDSQSTYTKHGDYFVLICILFLLRALTIKGVFEAGLGTFSKKEKNS